jgi:hypothetical protein
MSGITMKDDCAAPHGASRLCSKTPDSCAVGQAPSRWETTFGTVVFSGKYSKRRRSRPPIQPVAVRDVGISNSGLARCLRLDEKEARRILDPHHPRKPPRIEAALAALGWQIQIELA